MNFDKMKTQLTNHPKVSISILSIVIFLGFYNFIFGSSQDVAQNENFKKIELKSLNDISDRNIDLNFVGEVKSENQVEFRTQVTSVVSRVYVDIGDFVRKGQILVSLDNRDESAEYQKALADLEIEKNKLEELKKGTRDIEKSKVKVEVDNAVNILEDAKSNLEVTKEKADLELKNLYKSSKDSIVNAYNTVEKSINRYLDLLFENDDKSYVELTFYSKDFVKEQQVKEARKSMNLVLEDMRKISLDNNLDPLVSEENLRSISLNLILVRDFLIDVNDIINYSASLSESEISTYKSNIASARSEVSSSLDSINDLINDIAQKKVDNEKNIKQAETQLLNARNSFNVKSEDLNITQAGTREEQIKAQEARVKSLQANLSARGVKVSKTIFRSSINGVVSSVPVDTGNLVNNGDLVVSVVDRNNLEVTIFIDDKDLNYVKQGMEVSIESGKAKGIIQKVAPSINPETRKVEAKVKITEGKENVLIGQFVNIQIKKTLEENNNIYILPISAVNIEDNEVFLYTVNENKIEKIPVKKGNIYGEYVEIIYEGDSQIQIITYVRGLEEGEEVQIK